MRATWIGFFIFLFLINNKGYSDLRYTHLTNKGEDENFDEQQSKNNLSDEEKLEILQKDLNREKINLAKSADDLSSRNGSAELEAAESEDINSEDKIKKLEEEINKNVASKDKIKGFQEDIDKAKLITDPAMKKDAIQELRKKVIAEMNKKGKEKSDLSNVNNSEKNTNKEISRQFNELDKNYKALEKIEKDIGLALAEKPKTPYTPKNANDAIGSMIGTKIGAVTGFDPKASTAVATALANVATFGLDRASYVKAHGNVYGKDAFNPTFTPEGAGSSANLLQAITKFGSTEVKNFGTQQYSFNSGANKFSYSIDIMNGKPMDTTSYLLSNYGYDKVQQNSGGRNGDSGLRNQNGTMLGVSEVNKVWDKLSLYDTNSKQFLQKSGITYDGNTGMNTSGVGVGQQPIFSKPMSSSSTVEVTPVSGWTNPVSPTPIISRPRVALQYDTATGTVKSVLIKQRGEIETNKVKNNSSPSNDFYTFFTQFKFW